LTVPNGIRKVLRVATEPSRFCDGTSCRSSGNQTISKIPRGNDFGVPEFNSTTPIGNRREGPLRFETSERLNGRDGNPL
jgi:hypothetical protein